MNHDLKLQVQVRSSQAPLYGCTMDNRGAACPLTHAEGSPGTAFSSPPQSKHYQWHYYRDAITFKLWKRITLAIFITLINMSQVTIYLYMSQVKFDCPFKVIAIPCTPFFKFYFFCILPRSIPQKIWDTGSEGKEFARHHSCSRNDTYKVWVPSSSAVDA